MVRTADWIKQGWALVQQDLWMHVLIALIIGLIAGTGLGGFIAPTLVCGWIYIFLMKLRNPSFTVQIGDVFSKGFEVFVPSLVAGIILGVFLNIGFGLCVLPGFVVAGMTVFAYPLIMDKRMDFWPAIQASFEFTKSEWLAWSIFGLVLGLLYLVGVLLCVVGVLIAAPIAVASVAVAYEQTMNRAAPSAPVAPTVPPAA